MKLFPPEEFDRKDIEEGIDFIKTYHSNKSKKIIMPEEELNKNLYFKAKLVKLRLEVPQEHYSVDYQKHLEESSFYLPLPSRPSVDQLFSRYKSEYYPDVPHDQEVTENLIRDRKEISKLVQRMIPDDPLGKFFEFIEELKKEGVVPARKSNLGLSSTNIDSEIEGEFNHKIKTNESLTKVKLFFDVKGLEWKNILLEIVSNSELKVKVKDRKARRFTYSQLGLNDSRKGDMPNRIWKFIETFAKQNGHIPYDDLKFRSREKDEKRVSELRKLLKQWTSLNSNPITFSKKNGYQSEFKIRDSKPYPFLDLPLVEENMID